MGNWENFLGWSLGRLIWIVVVVGLALLMVLVVKLGLIFVELGVAFALLLVNGVLAFSKSTFSPSGVRLSFSTSQWCISIGLNPFMIDSSSSEILAKAAAISGLFPGRWRFSWTRGRRSQMSCTMIMSWVI